MNDANIKPILENRQRYAFQRSENVYQNIYDIAPLAFVIWDSECRIQDWNKRAETMFGWKRDQVLGENFFDYIIPEKEKHKVNDIVKALLDGNMGHSINENVTKSGEVILCEWKNSILYDDDGEVSGIISLGLDVTERKRAEDMLRKSEKKYRLFVENAHDVIFVAQEGMLKFFNPYTAEMLGYSEKELAAIPFLDLVHPEDRDMVLNSHTRRLKGEESPNYYTFRAITREGEEIWAQINSVLISWEGRPATLSFVRDVTKEHRLQTQLFQAQKMQAIGTLAGGIAHDFNNILSAIIGYTEMSIFEAPEESDIPRKLEQVLLAGKRAKNLVNQILTFSRQNEQEKKPLHIQPIAKEAVKFLRASIPSSIAIRENIKNDTGVIIADPTRIHQIIMNLCTNAAHSMKDKGGIIEISLEKFDLDEDSAGRNFKMSPGPYVRLSVADTGCGMDDDTVRRIFDPYFTTKEQGDGTGLGLSVVHGIVKSFGGTIKVYTEPDNGSIFHIYFPRSESDFNPEKKEGLILPTGNEKILLVDDEEMVLNMSREMLESLGYEVTSRSSSIEALEAFRSNPNRFDLLITDQTMPKMTGEKLAHEIIKLRLDIPIILCTGFSATITEERAEVLGIRAFLFKPILKNDLAKTVREVLDKDEGSQILS